MTNEEKAVIDAAVAWALSPVGDGEVRLLAAINALPGAPGERKFMVVYTWTDAHGAGDGNVFASYAGPITEQTICAWQVGIARQNGCNGVVVHSWTELEG